MQPEASLPHSQTPATCPYPEQIDPVHVLQSHFLKIHIIILPPTLSSFNKTFPQVFLSKPCMHFLDPCYLSLVRPPIAGEETVSRNGR
jgi:hypothetical protein